MICESPFSAKSATIRIGEKNVLLVPEVRRFGVIFHLEQKPIKWHVGLNLHYLQSLRMCVTTFSFKVELNILCNYAYA
jgi:hypothetical protein